VAISAIVIMATLVSGCSAGPKSSAVEPVLKDDDVRTFYWETSNLTGPAGVLIQFELDAKSGCEFTLRASGQSMDPGLTEFVAIGPVGEGLYGSLASRHHRVWARSDSTGYQGMPPAQGTGYWWSRTSIAMPIEARIVRLLAASPSLALNPDAPWPHITNSIAIQCDSELRALQMLTTSDVRFIDATRMTTGATLGAFGAGSASAQLGFDHVMDAPNVTYAFYSDFFAGQFSWSTPLRSANGGVAGDSWWLEDGPGRYTARLTGVGTESPIYGVLLGHHGQWTTPQTTSTASSGS
jgi:hypothetical protein